MPSTLREQSGANTGSRDFQQAEVVYVRLRNYVRFFAKDMGLSVRNQSGCEQFMGEDGTDRYHVAGLKDSILCLWRGKM